MSTTHKTLRGPRGAVILVTDKGLARDPDLGNKIDRAVFPGLQGGPHDNVTAAIAVALKEAARPEFRTYARQIVLNAKILAQTLLAAGIRLTTGGTDNHLMVVDLRPLGLSGNVVAEALETANIVVNRNSVPHDTSPPFYPSGIRLGTPAVTSRGMTEREMPQIGQWITEVIAEVGDYRMPENKSDRPAFLKRIKSELSRNRKLSAIAGNVKRMCARFPVV
ncbi:hypothetical protein A2Z33_01550 [Candidatus Gottesmanbacteria bacterium RBG_16_52_11]|uniref:Serine hydroxymethyltransferase-like domain-containing protein n=1 Tax=Candidatus Gottesmanbacteria bacterium RBG_16_52_11 TaxID=1798374 RepID=A0A1F5YP58_9BACT|nr:MAG: hypothetical protein A2Z33_01550 [Candidatus Gottesmanbacteria bacterium RBG_16_52_11]